MPYRWVMVRIWWPFEATSQRWRLFKYPPLKMYTNQRARLQRMRTQQNIDSRLCRWYTANAVRCAAPVEVLHQFCAHSTPSAAEVAAALFGVGGHRVLVGRVKIYRMGWFCLYGCHTVGWALVWRVVCLSCSLRTRNRAYYRS